MDVARVIEVGSEPAITRCAVGEPGESAAAGFLSAVVLAGGDALALIGCGSVGFDEGLVCAVRCFIDEFVLAWIGGRGWWAGGAGGGVLWEGCGEGDSGEEEEN